MFHQSNTAAALQFPYNAMSVEAVPLCTAVYRVTMNCRATATVSSTKRKFYRSTLMNTGTPTSAFTLTTAFQEQPSIDLVSRR